MRPHRLLLVLFLLAPAAAAQAFVECTRVVHTFTGDAQGDFFGWVSCPLPDVDGDGVQELAVTAPGHASGAGRVVVYDGRTGVERFHRDGLAGEGLGASVRDAGDVDGDGLSDVIAGGAGSGSVPGVAYVLSGVDGTLLHAIRLGSAGDAFGYAVTGLGDLDGDGVPELAIGAISDAAGGANTGRVWVVSGADGTTVVRDLVGLEVGGNFGSGLGNLGDVNGDGVAELAIGAANAGPSARGRVYVYDLRAPAAPLYTVTAAVNGVEFGRYFVATAGEVDGDGVPDLYVGDYAHAGGRGRAYVYSGASGALLWFVTGTSGSGFGIGRPLGDVDGDGRTDLVLASYLFSGGAAQAGKAEIRSGVDGHLLRTLTSTTAGENLGFDAHGLGDVDGDGVPEMVLTAATFDGNRGRVYVVARAPLEAEGAGLAGSGGIVPSLTFTGCPRPGESVSFEIGAGRGSAAGVLLLGAARRDRPFRGGVLHPDSVFLRLGHRLSGVPGASGTGTASLATHLPDDPALLGRSFHAQALYLDPGAAAGTALTAGLRIEVY